MNRELQCKSDHVLQLEGQLNVLRREMDEQQRTAAAKVKEYRSWKESITL